MNVLNGLESIYIDIKNNHSSNNECFIPLLELYSDMLLKKNKINSKRLRSFKKDIKANNIQFYKKNKKYFSVLKNIKNASSYDYDNALKHMEALVKANDFLIDKIKENKDVEIKIMASSLQNYPSFILSKDICKGMSGKDFYDKYICYYSRIYKTPFLEEYKNLFY
ncbi:hypothetical protein CM240_3335 [Clostridium bornimense]|uniref:Uncharacterized protein n=2 Tax=Clostridium bornimense TaxID=1216932 RepID=W6S7T0_9CLOT|nr:hypothetical protein CM240_3335 [Clostridium bornimense]